MQRWFRWILLAGVLAGHLPAAFAGPRESAGEAEREGRWAQALALREKSWVDSGQRADGEAYLRVLDALGRDEDLIREAGRMTAQFPGWDLPPRLAARAEGRSGHPGKGAARLAEVTTPAAQVDRARLLRQAGKPAEAGAVLSGVRRTTEGREVPPEDLWARAHGAAAEGAFEEAARWFETAYRESLGFIEARLDLARLFQEKYQENLAQEELADARKLAGAHPDVAVAAAEIGLASNRLSQAETDARYVLTVRPNDPAAPVVLARLALIAELPGEAVRLLGPPLERDPGHRAARSVLAAARYLAGDAPGWEAERERVLAEDPSYLDVFLGLARVLEMSRRNDEAFALYDAVLERDPDAPGALLGKGLLLMREGKEKEARPWLERGFEGDPFNIRAYNQLELLDKMETFATHRTGHFIIHYEASADSLLIPLVAEALETIREELVELHGWEPPVPTVVEIFPSHDWFSARVTGFPWIGGIPAVCFGDVIAMDSPRTLAGESNWEEILRHEFGHVLALGMSNKKMPHWFTEGVSVHLEQHPRGPAWDETLVAAYEDGELIGLDSLSIGFTRPKSQAQRLLAYYQAGIVVDDIVARHGWKRIPGILDAIGRGQSFPEAYEGVTGESYAALRTQALRAVRLAAETSPVWPTPSRPRPLRLFEAWERNPKDVALGERLALAQFQLGMADPAESTSKKLLELDQGSSRAKGILGLLQLGDVRGEDGQIDPARLERARRLLTEAVQGGSRDLPVIRALADQELAQGDSVRAEARLGQLLEIYPQDPAARLARARLLAARGDREGARREYRILLGMDAGAGDGAVELARLEIEEGRGPEAASAIGEAVAVLPLSATVEALRGQAYLLLGQDSTAYRILLGARKLDVRNVEVMVGFASFYSKHGDFEEAAYFAELALKYDPEHPRARAIRDEALRP